VTNASTEPSFGVPIMKILPTCAAPDQSGRGALPSGGRSLAPYIAA
jgi:hypothetical protein